MRNERGEVIHPGMIFRTPQVTDNVKYVEIVGTAWTEGKGRDRQGQEKFILFKRVEIVSNKHFASRHLAKTFLLPYAEFIKSYINHEDYLKEKESKNGSYQKDCSTESKD